MNTAHILQVTKSYNSAIMICLFLSLAVTGTYGVCFLANLLRLFVLYRVETTPTQTARERMSFQHN